MKKRSSELLIFIFTALAFSYFSQANAGTCSNISRTSFGANTVLTSAELNGQFDTVFNAANALDGGCITDGTLEKAALDSTEWAPVYNQVQGGCKVSYTDADTLSISKCAATVNNNFIGTTIATSIDMGCTGCSSETATSDYYVYIKSDSSGTTLNPLILTGAPNEDGYDASSNKVIARFHNNGAGDIDQYSIDQWSVNKFVPQETGRVDGGTITIGAVTTAPTADTMVADQHYFTRLGETAFVEVNWVVNIAAITTSGSGNYLWTLPAGIEFPESTFNTGANIYGTATELYGPLYFQILITATVYVGNAFIVPYNKTQYRVWIGQAQNIDGNSAYSESGTFVGSASWPINRAPTLKGSFSIYNSNWDY